MKNKINIKLEEWQVRTLRCYFGQNDKTQVAHWAFEVFDEALKQQCDIPVVVGQSEQLSYTKTNKIGQCLTCGDTDCCDDFCNG